MTTPWKHLLLASALLAPACVDDAELTLDSDVAEIVGGTPESIKDFPSMVSLFGDRGHHCGGTILDERHILTARHCFSAGDSAPRGLGSPKDFKVAAGMSNLSKVSTEAQVVDIDDVIVIADGYDASDEHDGRDIIVARLAKPLRWSSKVQPVDLATAADQRAGRLRPGVVSTVTGWGKTSTDGPLSDRLLSVEVPIVPEAVLEAATGGPVSADLFGAGGQAGKDSCSGDSGGPLFVRRGQAWVQAGVVSFGISDCAVAGEPAGYTHVPTYHDAIQRATREKQTVIKRKDNLSGKEGDVRFVEVRVPAGQREVNFNVFGAGADVDLRVKKGARPSTDDFDCKSAVVGPNGETCNFAQPEAGTYWISIEAFEDYDGLDLRVNGYSAPSDDC